MADSTKDQKSSGLGYIGYAATLSALTGIVGGQMQTQAFETKLNSATNAAIRNSKSAITSYEVQQTKNAETIDNINQVLGDKLSERGLTAIKEAALFRTAAAETGTSGGTTEAAAKEAFINENMDRANIISTARQQQRNLLVSMDTQAQGIRNSIDSMLLGGITEVNTNPLLSGLAGGLNVVNSTLSMIPMSESSKIFGIKPEGTN